MKNIALVPSQFLMPFYQMIKNNNIRCFSHQTYLDRVMGKINLPVNTLVSVIAVRDLLVHLATMENPQLDFDLGLRHGLLSVPEVKEEIETRKLAIIDSVELFCCYANSQYNQAAYWCEFDQKGLWFCRQTAVDINRTNNVLEQYTLGIMTALVRLVLGQTWQPEQVHYQQLEGFITPQALTKTQLYIGQQDTRMLLTKRDIGYSDITEPTKINLSQLNDFSVKQFGTFKQQIIDLLAPYIGSKMPALNDIVILSGISSRTIQRQLTKEQTSYRNICNELNMKYAKTVIRSNNLSISQLSVALGYTNIAHFSNAFKTYFGTSPRAFKNFRARQRA